MLGNMQQHTLGVAALSDLVDRNDGSSEGVSPRLEASSHRASQRRITARSGRTAMAACTAIVGSLRQDV